MTGPPDGQGTGLLAAHLLHTLPAGHTWLISPGQRSRRRVCRVTVVAVCPSQMHSQAELVAWQSKSCPYCPEAEASSSQYEPAVLGQHSTKAACTAARAQPDSMGLPR